MCGPSVEAAHKAPRVWRMVKRDGRRPYPPPMADSDRVLDSVYGLEIVAPAAYVTGAAGVPRLDLVAALAAAAGGGGGAAVTIVETAANFSAEVGTHYEVNTSGAGPAHRARGCHRDRADDLDGDCYLPGLDELAGALAAYPRRAWPTRP